MPLYEFILALPSCDRALLIIPRFAAFSAPQGGFPAAIANIIIAGKPIIEGIVSDWDTTFKAGIEAQENWMYNSDDIHTLTDLRRRQVTQFKDLQRRSAIMRR
jgi:hypothetical protein